MKQLIDFKIEMRDDVKLSCDIRMQDFNKKNPVILVRTPYNNSELEERLYNFILDGYAVVTQDCRGKFDSDGLFHPLHEIKDGVDTIKWIESQDWCNGKIAMVGGSYCGCVQLSAACEKPESLKTIVPMVFSGNPYISGVYENSILRFFDVVWWSTKVSGRSLQSNITTELIDVIKHLPLSDIDKFAGYDIYYLQECFEHERYDDYWKNITYTIGLEDCKIPIFFISGWYDSFYKGTLKTFEIIQDYRKLNNLNIPLKIIIGPWTHSCSAESTGDLSFPNSDIKLTEIEKEWVDFFLKDKESSVLNSSPVKYYTMGLNKWQESECWPPKNTREKTLYLDSSGNAGSNISDGKLISNKPEKGGSDGYIYDPENPVITHGGTVLAENLCLNGIREQSLVESRGDVLIYSSDTLTEDIEVTGYVEAVLYVKSSVPDTDFFIKLCDVDKYGNSYNLCCGGIKMKYRDSNIEASEPIEPEKVYKIKIRIGATSNLFRKGHLIRIQLTSSNFPEYGRNLNTGEDSYQATKIAIAKQTILHSEEYPSRIILPQSF